jgi:hypothetical protein
LGADKLKERYFDLFAGVTLLTIKERAMWLGVCETDNDNIFTLYEDNLIRKYFPSMGSSMHTMLNNKSSMQVNGRAKKLSIRYNHRFTKLQDEIILKEYNTLGPKSLLAHYSNIFGGVSISQLSYRARRLGLDVFKRTHFSDEECELIKEHYPLMGPDMYTLLNSKSRTRVMAKASELGIKYDRSTNELFNEYMDELLVEYYPSLGAKGIKNKYSDIFSKTSVYMINKRADKLNIVNETYLQQKTTREKNLKLYYESINFIRCVETGEKFKNIERALKYTGQKNLRDVILSGLTDNRGYHWEIVPIED